MSQYANWTKDTLIARITALENAVPAGPANPGPASAAPAAAPAATPAVPAKKKKGIDFSKFAKRRVAIRFAYLGWNYHGLAFQKDGHTTVEGEIIRALHKTRCIPTLDPADCNFSRCGRTDADVSAMAQVISLDLRSQLSGADLEDAQNDSRELDYLKILNSNLPADILAYQICLRPPQDFDARFSCLSRHYHYHFLGTGLDLAAMQDAARRLVGEHDFRNMCKIDGSKQITNFRRRVLSAEIVERGDGMCYLSLKGTAFLWNQVRSIMAILLLVGQRREQPAIIDRLLDVEATPQRPVYEIAWGVPLTLYNCEFPPMAWQSSTYTLPDSLYNLWYETLQKQAMTDTMLSVIAPHARPLEFADRANVGRGVGNRASKYVPLEQRAVCDAPEDVNRKWLEKKSKNRNASVQDN